MQEIVDRKKTKSARSLSKRVAALEAEVAELRMLAQQSRETTAAQPFKHNWEKTFGIFKDDPTHEEAVRLGQAWRRRQPKC